MNNAAVASGDKPRECGKACERAHQSCRYVTVFGFWLCWAWSLCEYTLPFMGTTKFSQFVSLSDQINLYWIS